MLKAFCDICGGRATRVKHNEDLGSGFKVAIFPFFEENTPHYERHICDTCFDAAIDVLKNRMATE